MNAIEFMRILQSKGVDVSYTLMDGAYDGHMYPKVLDKDIPCRPSLACTISNKDYYIKFVVADDCYENKYDSIFEHLFDTEDEEEMLGCMAGVDYDVIGEWEDAYTVGDVI